MLVEVQLVTGPRSYYKWEAEGGPCLLRDVLGGHTWPGQGPAFGNLSFPWSPSLQLKEHPEKGVYVKGLSMHTVHNVAQCERVMETGWKNRAVGYTLMNKDSSRSHSIFTINIEIYAVGMGPTGGRGWPGHPEPGSHS